LPPQTFSQPCPGLADPHQGSNLPPSKKLWTTGPQFHLAPSDTALLSSPSHPLTLCCARLTESFWVSCPSQRVPLTVFLSSLTTVSSLPNIDHRDQILHPPSFVVFPIIPQFFQLSELSSPQDSKGLTPWSHCPRDHPWRFLD